MFAIELRASICARLMRGTASIANTVALRPASLSSKSGFWAGQMKLIRVPPSEQLDFVLAEIAYQADEP